MNSLFALQSICVLMVVVNLREAKPTTKPDARLAGFVNKWVKCGNDVIQRSG